MSTAPAECCDPEHSAPGLVQAASRHIAAGDAAAALAALAGAAALDPGYLPLHFVTALMAWRTGDFAKALALTRLCFDREPMNGTVAEVLASLFAQVGDLNESLFHGKLATALKPDALLQELLPADFPSFDKTFLAIQDRPLFAHAKYLRNDGQIAPALDRARQHVEVAPEDAEARQFYAELLLRFGMADAAAQALQPVVTRDRADAALISLYARALTQVGEFEGARRWHEKASLAAPRDAEIAAARAADSRWLGEDPKEIAATAAKWVERFAKPVSPAPRRAPGEKLVIGYLVSDFVDRNDAAAVAAVALAHERSGARVLAYGVGAKSWDENIALGGAVDEWRDTSGLDPATLARVLTGDGLDVVIDLGGLSSPRNLQALARAKSVLRVAWLQNATGLEAIYDAEIAHDARRGPRTWPLGWGAYPLLRSSAEIERATDQILRFGADIRLCQLDRRTVEMWTAVLSAMPASMLLLRQIDMASPENISRLVDRFGRSLAARIDIVEAPSPAAFYRHVDIALAPAAGTSPRMVAESLGCGVPALALRNERLHQPYAAMLEGYGLATDLVAGSLAEFLDKAKSLASSAETRARVGDAIAATADAAELSASKIACAIEQAVRQAATEQGK